MRFSPRSLSCWHASNSLTCAHKTIVRTIYVSGQHANLFGLSMQMSKLSCSEKEERMKSESELCANHCMQISVEHDGATGDEWAKKRTRKVSKKKHNSGIIESHSNAVTTSIKNSSLRCELIDDCNLQNPHDFAISHHQRHFCSLQMMQMWVVQNNSDAGYNLQRVLK